MSDVKSSAARPMLGSGKWESEPKPDYGMPVHPVCDMFPLMQGDDFHNLGGDIRINGLVQPIVLFEGQIVDGRNRLLACRDVGVEPKFIQWRALYTGSMSIARWIWSVNVERRHLSIDQILAVEVEIKAWEEQHAAKQRKVEAGKQFHKGSPKVETNSPQPLQPASRRAPQVRKKLATATGASEHKVQQALNVRKADPDLLKAVAQGTTTLREADKQVKAMAPKAQLPSAPAFDFDRFAAKVMRSVKSALLDCTFAEGHALLSNLIGQLETVRAEQYGQPSARRT